MTKKRTPGVEQNNYYKNLLDLEALDPEIIRPTGGWREAIEFLLAGNRCGAIKQLIIDPLPYDVAQKIDLALLTKTWTYSGLQILQKEEVDSLSPKNLALRELEFWSGSHVPEDHLKVETPVRQDWLARKVDPNDPDKVLDFYRTTKSYIWELMAANNIIETLFNYGVVLRALQEHGVTEFIDYGAGAGSFVIAASSLGINGMHMDLASRTMDFARWRYEARNLDIEISEASGRHDDLPRSKAIVCLEVIEHLVEPVALLDAFAEAIPPRGFLVVSESCQYVDKFCAHLKSNQWLGGERFLAEMTQRNFQEVRLEEHIHPRIFRRVD